jgi:hypothetical protein
MVDTGTISREDRAIGVAAVLFCTGLIAYGLYAMITPMTVWIDDRPTTAFWPRLGCGMVALLWGLVSGIGCVGDLRHGRMSPAASTGADDAPAFEMDVDVIDIDGVF